MRDWLQTWCSAGGLRAWLLILVLAGTARAQRASISGIATDQSGGVLPDVHITLLNVDQGLQREAVSGSDGEFSAPWLQPGRYIITAQKTGFAIAEIKDILLHVGDSRSVHLEMLISAAPVRLEVDGRPQSVEDVDNTLGQVVTGDVIRDAPLNGRNVLDLALLQPGVNPKNDDDSSPGRFTVSGNRSDSVTYLLDGALNTDLLDNSVVFNPNPDTIAEFRILTSNYSAEFGRNAGGIVSVITKSGGSNFHGSGFDFFRNDALDSNLYFNKSDPANLLPRPTLKRNQFGATLGGPVGRPGTFTNHLFFFAGYQGERQVQGVSQQSIAFTPAEIQGDFSRSDIGPDGKPAPDPGVVCFLTGLPTNGCTALPHPYFQPNPVLAAQGIIDPSRINPIAQNYIQAGLIPVSPSGELNTQEAFHVDADEFTGKVDIEPTSRDRVPVTFGWNRQHLLDPYPFATVPGFAAFSDFGTIFTTIAWTHVFSPNLLNDVSIAFQRATTDQQTPAEMLPTPAELGINITPDIPSGPTNLVFDFGALSTGTGVLGPSSLANNTYTFSDTLSWVHGLHNWKFGGGFSPFQNNSLFAFYVNGRFDFIGSGGGIGSQNSFADFLMGIPASFTQSAAASSDIRTKLTDFFAQDQWHVRKNLVLTLGARYEYSSPKRDTEGRTFSIIPGLKSHRFPNAPTGMVFPGDPGAPTGVNFPDKNDWAGRLGFAWDFSGSGKTSLRGGFGIFYDVLKGEDNLQFNGQPPFYSSVGLTFATPADGPVPDLVQPFAADGATNPFPSHPPPQNINFATAGFLPVGSSGSVYIVDPHLRTPYTYQYSLSLERALGRNILADASYVGSSSHGLTALIDANPFVLGTSDRVLNLQPGNQSCPGTPAPTTCFAALPEFRNVVNADFNSLQLSLRKQFSDDRWFGRSYFTLAYTYTHNIDSASGFRNRNTTVPSYQPNLMRASADMDLRQRFIFSGGWELPFDRLSNSVPKAASKGWNIFPIVSYRSGFPVDVFANLVSPSDYLSTGPSAAGDPGVVRANLVGPIRIFDPHSMHTFDGTTGNYWFDPTSFSNQNFPTDQEAIANPAVRTYGSLSRNHFIGPGRFDMDLAFSKVTPLWQEHMNLEFRADFFNLFNLAQFRNPNTNINDPNFGKIQSTYTARVIQLAIRLSF